MPEIPVQVDELLEEGVYPAWDRGPFPGEHPEYGPNYMWVFQTEEGPEIIGFTSQSGSTRGNLVKRAMKILGLSKEDMRKGFNTEDLRDKPCQIMVESRTGDDEDNNIATNFMAPKKGQKAS